MQLEPQRKAEGRPENAAGAVRGLGTADRGETSGEECRNAESDKRRADCNLEAPRGKRRRDKAKDGIDDKFVEQRPARRVERIDRPGAKEQRRETQRQQKFQPDVALADAVPDKHKGTRPTPESPKKIKRREALNARRKKLRGTPAGDKPLFISVAEDDAGDEEKQINRQIAVADDMTPGKTEMGERDGNGRQAAQPFEAMKTPIRDQSRLRRPELAAYSRESLKRSSDGQRSWYGNFTQI